MKRYIVLLRGVMPSGKNKVPMAQLREVLIKAGFDNMRTYIQSGNALVDTELSAKEVEKQIHELIKKHIGPDLVVVVRKSVQLQKVLDENPFKKGHDISRVFFLLFAETPTAQRVEALISQDYSPDKIIITKDAAYLYIPGPYTKSQLNNNSLEKKLGVSSTMRNFNTISKLISMSNE